MNLGEIKAEALKLMFSGYDTISEGTVAGLSADENYSVYLDGMVGSINRCFSDLEAKGAIPEKRLELPRAAGRLEGKRILFNLSSLPVCRVSRVCAWNDGVYDGHCPYDLEGETLILEDDGSDYALIYEPRLPRVGLSAKDGDELGLPDHVACLIPYYIKGDLYRDDEPSEASEARNFYEAGVSALLSQKREKNVQKSVENAYDLI